MFNYRLCVCLFWHWKTSRRAFVQKLQLVASLFSRWMVCKRVSAANKHTSKHRLYISPFFFPDINLSYFLSSIISTHFKNVRCYMYRSMPIMILANKYMSHFKIIVKQSKCYYISSQYFCDPVFRCIYHYPLKIYIKIK